jgi:hypothetical protein
MDLSVRTGKVKLFIVGVSIDIHLPYVRMKQLVPQKQFA